MKSGKVVTIRVNARDCLSIIDIVDRADMYIPRMGFSAAVSIALSSMLEAYRQGKLIPDRDGFEYSQMMARFEDRPQVDRARKLAITATIEAAGSEARVPTVPGAVVADPAPTIRRAEIRWNELALRKQLTPENMSAEDESELAQLAKQLDIKSGVG